MSFPAPV